MRLPETERFNYEDYLTWDDDIRYELIEGISYAMSAPSWSHQGISRNILVQLANFLKDKPCKVYAAPFDVRLNPNGYDDTVVQPDILVVCDRKKFDKRGSIKGAPDMVAEILSPATARMDRFTKLNLYKQYGVREYWIVDPSKKIIETHILENGKYIKSTYTETDTAPVYILEGCVVTVKDVFEEL